MFPYEIEKIILAYLGELEGKVLHRFTTHTVAPYSSIDAKHIYVGNYIADGVLSLKTFTHKGVFLHDTPYTANGIIFNDMYMLHVNGTEITLRHRETGNEKKEQCAHCPEIGLTPSGGFVYNVGKDTCLRFSLTQASYSVTFPYPLIRLAIDEEDYYAVGDLPGHPWDKKRWTLFHYRAGEIRSERTISFFVNCIRVYGDKLLLTSRTNNMLYVLHRRTLIVTQTIPFESSKDNMMDICVYNEHVFVVDIYRCEILQIV